MQPAKTENTNKTKLLGKAQTLNINGYGMEAVFCIINEGIRITSM